MTPAKYRTLNRVVIRYIFKTIFSKAIPRRLSMEESFSNIRNDAAVGGWAPEISWGTMEEALADPHLLQMVDEERERHKLGKCTYGVYNTMGKKKKTVQFGRAKGSRMIWYLPIVERILEQEAFGFLNVDHAVERSILPCGVGGLDVRYLGYILREIKSRCQYLVEDDTAGWDTTIGSDDLDDEMEMLDWSQGRDDFNGRVRAREPARFRAGGHHHERQSPALQGSGG